MVTTCPTPEMLRRYALGACEEVAATQIESHLVVCPSCEGKLADFDHEGDSLLRYLPLAAATEPTQNRRRPGWLDRLRAGPPAAPAAATTETSDASFTGRLEGFSAYQLLGVLGEGGMGVVYRARHRQLHREVALKVLRPRLMSAAEARRRFNREIQILGRLDHAGIVMATDAGRVGQAAYLVMELIEGVDLARLVQSGGPLSVAEACEAGRQIATALAAAHGQGAIHRDVKPSNAMVDRQGHVKLLDFGLAQLATASIENRDTSLGRLLGTLDYMAPEQADGQTIGEHADLYGLGATLFFLLTGRAPHAAGGGTLWEKLRHIANEPAPSLSSRRAGVPEELDALVARLLSRDPAQRPANAASVAEQLAAWADKELAARAQEAIAAAPPVERTPEQQAEQAEESLCQLLETEDDLAGGTTAPLASTLEAATTDQPAVRRFRPSYAVGGLAALLLGAALWLGVVLLLQTPEGTLRIESEVDNLVVQLVDEAQRSQKLNIDRGVNETNLRVGRYRVRLAGEHDAITVTPQQIILRKGKETVARIARMRQARPPGMPTEVDPLTGLPMSGDTTQPVIDPLTGLPGTRAATDLDADRVYLGQSQSVWQRRFEAEQDPVAKMDAARALLTLAADLPPAAQVQRIIEVFSSLVTSGWGDEHLLVPLLNLDAGRSAPRWSGSGTEKWRQMESLASMLLRQIPPTILADQLGDAMIHSPPPAASTAAWLATLSEIENHIGEDLSAVARLYEQINVPIEGLDRTAVAAFVRASICPEAGHQQSILEALDELGHRLVRAPDSSERYHLASAWLKMAEELPLEESIAAELVLDKLLNQPSLTLQTFFYAAAFHGRYRYNQERIKQWRERRAFLLGRTSDSKGPWITVVNKYLRQHANQQNEQVAAVIRSLDYVLSARNPQDNWPVDVTARLLSERLARYYAADKPAVTDAPPEEMPGVTPALLLTHIVRITGEIPAFVTEGVPRSASVAERLATYEKLLTNGVTAKEFFLQAEEMDALIEVAPYQVVRIALSAKKLPAGLSTRDVLYATAAHERLIRNVHVNQLPPTDVILLLASFAVREPEGPIDPWVTIFAERTFTREIEEILSGRTALRGLTHDLLQRLSTLQSASLRWQIQQLDPTID